MEYTPIKKTKLKIFQLTPKKTCFKIYTSNKKNKDNYNSISLSPNSTIFTDRQNKTFYPKISFEQKLQITQSNRRIILKKRILHLEKGIKEKENNYLKFQKEKDKNEKEKKEEFKRKSDIRFIKQKFHKLIKNNQTKICVNFINKTNGFNSKIMEYLKGNNYLNQKVNFHKNFRFNSEYESHSRIQMITDLEKIKNNSQLFEKLNFNKLFNEKEKNYIREEPQNFIQEISKFKNLKLKGKKLVDKLNEEENLFKKKKKRKFINRITDKSTLSTEKKKLNLTFDKMKKENYERSIKEVDKEVTKILFKKLENEKKEENRRKSLEEHFKRLNRRLSTIKREKNDNSNYFKNFHKNLSFKNKYSLNKNFNHLQKFLSPQNLNIKKINVFDFQTIQSSKESFENEKKFLMYCQKRISDIYKNEENDKICKSEEKRNKNYISLNNNKKFVRTKTFMKLLKNIN